MRFGIYVGSRQPSVAGGGYTFQDSIFGSLFNIDQAHDLFVYYRIGERAFHSQQIIYSDGVQKSIDSGFYPSLIQATDENRLDAIWFITPTFEPVNIPYIVPVWDLQHRQQPYFPEVSSTGWTWDTREQFYSSVLPKATYIITGTNEGKKDIHKLYSIPEERIRVIPLPTPTFALKNTDHLNNYKLIFDDNMLTNYIFYPAQFWPHKNHIVLLHALKILEKEYNIVCNLVCSGSDHGNLDYILSTTKELGIEGRVIFVGFVSIEELSILYKNASCLIFPSLFGPDNLPPLEAFGFGCPVIASDIPGAREQLCDAALFFNATDEYEIAASYKMLMENDNLRKDLINRGIKRAHSWTSDHYVNEINGIVTEFSKRRRCWQTHPHYVYQIRNIDKNPLLRICNISDITANDKKNANLIGIGDSLCQKAERLYQEDNIEEAILTLLEAIKNDDESYIAFNDLGVIYWHKGDKDKATNYLKCAMEKNPAYKPAVINYAEILSSCGDSNNARNVCADYLRNNPNDNEIKILYDTYAKTAQC